MSNIATKLTYLNGTKQAIKQAINEDFEVIDDNTTFREYADEISSNNAKYKDLIPKETTNATNTLDISNSSGLDKALVTQYGNTKQSILPSEYTQVDYIQSSGTQYIDTGVNADTNLRVILDMAYTNPLSANQAIGSIKIGTPNVRYHLLPTTTEINFWVNDNSYRIAGNDSDRHLIDLNVPNGQVLYDNNVITIPTNISDTGLNFWLFGRNSTTNIYLAKIKQWACKMYYNNVLVRDFIPCYRNSDNEVGLYDLVNDVFYTNQNQGTDAFTYGSKTPTPDTPQEIVNISGKSTLKDVGKNLFDKNAITERSYVLNDGTLQTGTSYEYNTSDFIPIQPNTTYYKTLSLSPRTKFYDANKQVLDSSTYQDISIGGNAGTFTTPANAYYFRFTINTNVSTGVSLDSVMVHKGSEATTYEPYKEQSFEINLGYNLFKTPYNESSKTKNGITFTINEDGSIHVEGTATAKTQFNLRNRDLLLGLNIGERYTIATSGLGTVDSTIWLDTYGQTGNFLGRWSLSSSTPYTSAVAEAKDNKPLISITVENGATINTDVKVWLYKGAYDSSIEYTPYITPIELSKIGDYKDRIYPLNGKWYLEKKIGKVVLSQLTWVQETSANSRRYSTTGIQNSVVKPTSNSIIINMLCNIYIKNSATWSWNTTSGKGIAVQKNGQLIIFDEDYTNSNDLTNFTTMLGNKNAVLYYPLTTPTTEEITDSNYPTLYNQLNNIKLFEGVNHITMTNESGLDVEFDIEYYKDWKLD